MTEPVVTSGVVLRWRDRFVFQTGLNRARDRLGVVRLGGHVEPDETAAACAVREAQEEANVAVRLISATTTHGYVVNAESFDLLPASWRGEAPAPLLVASMTPEPGSSITYLAETEDEPRPGSETQALVFLTADEVELLTSTPTTLGAFLVAGGVIVEAFPLPRELVLFPHGQLRALARLLAGGLPDG
jgi:8-oxo-dGTP pyrophosphatase MutT (NUDIX family)